VIGKDKVLIIMPEYFEDFLWALPVGQTYLMYGEWKLDRMSECVVVCKEEYKFLAKMAFPLSNICCSVDRESLDLFDVVIAFDREKAIRIGCVAKLHAVVCYGISCGANSGAFLPTIGQKLTYDDLKIVFVQRSVMDYKGLDYQYPFNKNRYIFEKAFAGAHLFEMPSDTPVDVAYEELSSAAFVFGVVGGYSLLAASMQKPVLEIYPEKSLVYREWGAKWSNSMYKVIPAEIEQVAPEFLASTLDRFIGELSKRGNKWRSLTTLPSTDRAGERLIQMEA